MATLSHEERRVINALYVAHKPLTTKNVAERSEMAWQTAKKYLTQLQKKGYVRCGRYGKSIYWWLNV
jgi:Mn-dependent DtxR family transcriptional regulator